MSHEDDEVISQLRKAQDIARGHADFFAWPIDRGLEELGVVSTLAESLQANSSSFFGELKLRGRSNDPPDCEALDSKGERIALEVTELVDGDAIRSFKAGRHYDWPEWTRSGFLEALAERIAAKNKCYPRLKDAPYDGGYVVVLHTDEPMLPRATVKAYLANHHFDKPDFVDRAFLLLSYDPSIGLCPYFELSFCR